MHSRQRVVHDRLLVTLSRRFLRADDHDSLSRILAHGQWVAAGIAFLAGLTSSFGPVALAALPVSLA